MRARSSLQFVGLHEIVVGADLEADDPVDGAPGRRRHDDAGLAGLADEAGERQPVLARHGDVEDGDVDRLAGALLAEGLGVAEAHHLEALELEIFPDRLAQMFLVVDDGHGGSHCGCPSVASVRDSPEGCALG
jgi:hypothetical protein